MNVFLLAAGEGARLKPYTETIPKCLIPIHGMPMLEIWLNLLDKYHIREVLINTHHHAEKVDQFIRQMKPRVRLKIRTCYEKKLLGSGGTIIKNREFVSGARTFIIAYADNLTNINLTKMVDFHEQCRSKGGVLTMGLFHTPHPENCGIAVLDKEKKVVNFIEKPKNPVSDLANAGIYIASQDFFEPLSGLKGTREGEIIDIGYHILPLLIGKMYGYKVNEYIRDIGTKESYHKALDECSTDFKGFYDEY